MKKLSVRRKGFYITAILLLIGLVSLEIFFRNRYGTVYMQKPVFQYDDTIGFKYRANYDLVTKTGRKIHINKYGFFGPDWNINKKEGTYRIAVVGACRVSGVTHIEDTNYYKFPALAENILIKKGYNVEILNFGIDGMSNSYNQYLSVDNEVRKFKPDLILYEFNEMPLIRKQMARDNYFDYQLEYVLGSPSSKSEAINWADKIHRYRFFEKVFDNCYLIKALCRNYVYRFHNNLSFYFDCIDKKKVRLYEGDVNTNFTIEESVQMLHELIKRLATDKSIFYLYTYGFHQGISDFCLRNNLPYKFIGDYHPTRDMIYAKDNHLNNLGQLYLSERVADLLIREFLTQSEQ
jgi:acetyltransferase-like isoleucine patch superfamily enzyme